MDRPRRWPVVPLLLVVGLGVLARLTVVRAPEPIQATSIGSAPMTIAVDGRPRSFTVHVPPDTDHPLPLLLVLHGAGGTGKGIEADTGFSDLADDRGFAVAYPDGRHETWNAGGCCLASVAENVPDITFLRRLIDRLVADGVARPDRVYVTGFSNGGMMAARLACEDHRVDGVAIVAGALVSPCPATDATAVLVVHGTEDPMVPPAGYDGVLKTGQPLHYPPLDDAVATWRRLLACGTSSDVSQTGGIRVERWSECARGRQIELTELVGMGHAWPGNRASPTPDDQGFDASAAVLRAFGLAAKRADRADR